ncbi:Phytanoyl-CoA dioxygenase (PhyH) [Thalassoglobus neptunius]|uniref:Phytanoyl-CoA dioxygenase (PhyH) n=1 Tax=Thalassoglobus neptunius TaxID=1938619 RepID=A0A5C5WIQ5_9PLAN|nr:phytanoyl-CoA dioxygenase family protein [Thalassoglobus neptunius]TWT49891.1 Phytanoyl-CoA dioxygenase (PhyH) [Thalassoglobus neptunius]
MQRNPQNVIDESGWELIPGAYGPEHLSRISESLERIVNLQDSAVRQSDGAVYAARNVLQLVPNLPELWPARVIVQRLKDVLGPRCGLVRALYFDKPPQQTWALPWHKDLLIAIESGSPKAENYSRPRLRAGVLHTEPPIEVLQSMLTVRIHLDPTTETNGCLRVLSGSHQSGKELIIDGYPMKSIHSRPGDVLLMRPLLVHASGRSKPECQDHRRILHLEFAAHEQLPAGVRWHTFHRVD